VAEAGSCRANRYKVTLTAKERARLTELTRRGKATRAKFIHARTLLLCDAGECGEPWKMADVAAALGVTARTIEPRSGSSPGERSRKMLNQMASAADEGQMEWELPELP
jgi:hypothetical protein